MADKQDDLRRSHVEDAIAAEKHLETRLRDFASGCDDDEIKETFFAYAGKAHEHHEKLVELFHPADAPSNGKTLAARLFGPVPVSTQTGFIQEERPVQYLIVAYTSAAAAAALYETLVAPDGDRFSLGPVFQADHAHMAEKLFHLIPTRSIIAYNMLTVAEIDPSVETKVGEASWIS